MTITEAPPGAECACGTPLPDRYGARGPCTWCVAELERGMDREPLERTPKRRGGAR